jgi:HD-GYP domain-containing protein (c-di-GMP phosphodiesterase class II)
LIVLVKNSSEVFVEQRHLHHYMSKEPEINSVNSHFLEKVMELAEEKEILACEDIFDSRKIKLIAKGAKITRSQQERLIMRKLSKPLESSITVEGAVDNQSVVSEARHVSETVEPVSWMLQSTTKGQSFCPFKVMGGAPYGHAVRTMLTVVDGSDEDALAHSVMVSLMSVCLANNMRLNDSQVAMAGIAGLLHDIGELYVEPQYLSSKRRLLPHEWRHVIVHPRIGQMLISELEKYPEDVSRAIFEHHERFDGGGYPRHISGKNISLIGQIVGAAEMLSGIFARSEKPAERAVLALKIIPGEHASNVVAAVCQSLADGRKKHECDLGISIEDAKNNVCKVFNRISRSFDGIQELLDSPTLSSIKSKELLNRAMRQVGSVRQAFSATGLYVHMDIENKSLIDAKNLEILFEAVFATREIQWRLQDVARNIALQSTLLDPDEAELLHPLINLLDQGG